MSKHGSARAVLAGAAIIALAGCGVPTGTAPDIPGETTGRTSAGASSLASSAAPATGRASSARQSPAPATSTATASRSFAKANSIPFPVAVGNTWVYRTLVGNEAGQTTNRIVAAGPSPAGYQVTMSSTTDVGGTASAVQPVYMFYPDGTIGYPVAPVNGVPVTAGAVRWPNAAGLASGRAYHSVLPVQDSQTGQTENADVTVWGAGTTSVGVPAGIYQASVVHTTIAAKAGTIEVITWIAQGVGPVKTEVLIRVAGKTELAIADELVSYTTQKAVVGVGS